MMLVMLLAVLQDLEASRANQPGAASTVLQVCCCFLQQQIQASSAAASPIRCLAAMMASHSASCLLLGHLASQQAWENSAVSGCYLQLGNHYVLLQFAAAAGALDAHYCSETC